MAGHHKKHKKKTRKIKGAAEHQATFLAPPTDGHTIEGGEEVIEMADACDGELSAVVWWYICVYEEEDEVMVDPRDTG